MAFEGTSNTASGEKAGNRDRNPRLRSFTLILGGGGARGFAHIGVLRMLERLGWVPSAIVGVSMGAVVGAAYAGRTDWYSALLQFARTGFEGQSPPEGRPLAAQPSKLRQIASGARAMWQLGRGWGADTAEIRSGRSALHLLLEGLDLQTGRIPVAVSTTDLRSGDRVVIRGGPSAEAAYASSALAGVLPPSKRGERLLADGAYTDICPIDVAKEFGHEAIVAVNPGRSEVVENITSGLQAILRATEICYQHHAALRFDEADVVIRPPFRRAIDTLEFGAYRECIAAGIRGARGSAHLLQSALIRC